MTNQTHPLDPLSFPLQGARLIEASAGTGKTFTIAMLYLRLVLQHGDKAAFERPLAPQNILVVTFTKAATEELRDRIRRRLEEAAEVFRHGSPAVGDALLRQLRDSYPPERWPAQARRLELAANSMDEAAVHTIHAWAQLMLRQHAFDSGSRFHLELQTDDSLLYQEAARDYWRTFVYPLDKAVYPQVKKQVADPDALAKKIRHWPEPDADADADADAYHLAPLKRWQADCATIASEVRALWQQEQTAIQQWFDTALANGWLHGSSHKSDATRLQLEELDAWAEGRLDLAIDAQKHGKLAASRIRLNKKATPPELRALQALDRLLARQDDQPDSARLVFDHAKRWCEARVEMAKQRLAVLSFNDLLIRLNHALHGPNGKNLAQLIRRQFPVALIDEFQDTDPVQYRLFRRIYLDPAVEKEEDSACGLFMIGDPKQAIYSFRGADIFTYLKARQDTSAQYTLDTNFRSTQAMVTAANELFGQAQARDEGAFLFKDEIPYSQVSARGRQEVLQIAGEPATALTFWSHSEPCNKAQYLNSLANACASHIRQLLQTAQAGQTGFLANGELQPLAPADIAILVRDRHEAAAIREALSVRGLRSAYLSDRESPFASAEAQDLRRWLQAVAEAESESRLRLALATPTLRLPLSELDSAPLPGNNSDARWESRVEAFREYRQLWQNKGVLVMLRRLLDDFELPARLLQTELTDGERILTNLLQLGELLQQAATQLDGEHALIRYLAEQIDQAAQQTNDAHILRLESDDELIKVVTIHKSKGLEYPLVFLPFIGTSRPIDSKGSAFYRWHDEQRQPQLDFDKQDANRIKADRERLAEDLRLLYVAITRARHACWLGVVPLGRFTKNGYTCQLRHSAIGHLLSQGQDLPPDLLAGLLSALAARSAPIGLTPLPADNPQRLAPADNAEALAAARLVVRPPSAPWWMTSYSGLVAGATLSHLGKPPENPPALAEDSAAEATADETLREALISAVPSPEKSSLLQEVVLVGPHAFPRGAQPGTFLHSLLEWAGRQGFSLAASDAALRRDTLARYCQTRGWESWIDPLNDWMEALLNTPLPLPLPLSESEPELASAGAMLPALALASLSPTRIQPEMEFWFASHSTSLTALDRLVQQHVLPGQPRPDLRSQTINGMLKGFIDLVFEHEGRYYVADYKSNWLGPDDDAYSAETMNTAILEHRYDLQYSLYCLALHRLLTVRLPDYDYDRHMGGAVYLFLRGIRAPGQGVHAHRPARALIEGMDKLFAA